MGGDRNRKVAEQIQRHLSSRLIPALRDPRLGFATVTGVEVSRDLKSARVYVTIYEPDESKRRKAMAALNGVAGRFRREIASGLGLRYAPSLQFLEDASIERADRIERLILEIQRDRPAGTADEASAAREDPDEPPEPDDEGAALEDPDEPPEPEEERETIARPGRKRRRFEGPRGGDEDAAGEAPDGEDEAE